MIYEVVPEFIDDRHYRRALAPGQLCFCARARLNRGTYHSANSPMHTPATQVQIHHRSSAGNWLRRISKITSAAAHPAVPMTVTRRSLASSGGGAGRLGRVTWPG